MNKAYIVLIDYHHDVDGYEEVNTSIAAVFSHEIDAKKFVDHYNLMHPIIDEDYYFFARIETWGIDTVNLVQNTLPIMEVINSVQKGG